MSVSGDGSIGAAGTGSVAVDPTAVSKNESEVSKNAVAATRDVFID